MAADDPISALQFLNESDERQQSQIRHFAKPFLNIVKLFTSGETRFTFEGISAAIEWANQQPWRNLSDLVNVIAAELKYRGEQIDKSTVASEEHRRFVAEEMPRLILDSMWKAERLRATERIGRLGRILVHAAEQGPEGKGPAAAADYAEEMLRVATTLDERDVYVLGQIVRLQRNMLDANTGRVKHYSAHSVARDLLACLRPKGFSQGEADSICAKLESFGLVSRTERNVNLLADDPTPYALLQKGLDFTEYITSPVPASDRLSTTAS